MVLYEYPFNESMRTLLRLEHLFDRLGQLIVREAAVDHHFALVTMFEIIEVAARSDLKSELLKELERHKAQLLPLRDNPQIDGQALDRMIGRLDAAFEKLNAQSGKAGQSLSANEWLMSVKSRISIPGGTCEFDLPAYYAWQQLDANRRRQDLMGWIHTLAPLAEALQLLMQLVRETGVPHKVATSNGQYQQSLPQGRSYQLLRLRIDADEHPGLVPEITGHRLMVAVRLMRVDGDGRLRPAGCDSHFELALCS